MAIYASVLDLIGNTPMVDVSILSPNPKVKIYAKLEGQNPGGSVKDRIALSMIEDAEKDGRLRAGATLIESSSGNTGIGLALVCRQKGYKLTIVLPANVTAERRQTLEAFGACCTLEGILPALESAHALAGASRLAAKHSSCACI